MARDIGEGCENMANAVVGEDDRAMFNNKCDHQGTAKEDGDKEGDSYG